MSRAPHVSRHAPSRHLGVLLIVLASSGATACGEGPTTPAAPSVPAPTASDVANTYDAPRTEWQGRIPSGLRRESIPGADPAPLSPIPSR